MIFRAVWQTVDPDEETEGSYRAALMMIPAAVKRRFGFVAAAREDATADAERVRLDGYTNWDND